MAPSKRRDTTTGGRQDVDGLQSSEEEARWRVRWQKNKQEKLLVTEKQATHKLCGLNENRRRQNGGELRWREEEVGEDLADEAAAVAFHLHEPWRCTLLVFNASPQRTFCTVFVSKGTCLTTKSRHHLSDSCPFI